MSDFELRWANEADDEKIRECLKDNPMKGDISITFEAEPSALDAVKVIGPSRVIVGYLKDELVGFGVISEKELFINGESQRVGYLSALRVNQQYRGRRFLKQGFDAFRQHHQEQPLPFYITSILESNTHARAVLERGRANLPDYHFHHTLNTHIIVPSKKDRPRRDIGTGDMIGLEHIVEFMHEQGSKRQFFPHYTTEDFGTEKLRGLQTSDFYVAVEGNEIVGIAGVWNQGDFKQARVVDYSTTINMTRKLLGLASTVTRAPRLPPKGELLDAFYVSFPLVKDDDPNILRDLISAISHDHHHSNYFIIGLSETDPLNAGLEKFSPRTERFRAYTVTFEEPQPKLDDRTPYLEIATL